MNKEILYVGVDVDDKAFHGSFLTKDGKIDGKFCIKPNLGALLKQLQKLSTEYEVRVCYEATYLAFSLKRGLVKAGFECAVIAPSLIPEVAGDHIKTDRLDARKLALYFMNGLLTEVIMPSEEEEKVRDLIRSRFFLTKQMRSTKLFITSLCRRMGLHYKENESKGYWTLAHRAWLRQQTRDEVDVNSFNLKMLLLKLEQAEAQIELFNDKIEQLAQGAAYKDKVKALSSFRGIDLLTAMVFITEIGDVRRFKKPTSLVSYAGMDLKEHSSGGKQHQFSMTKMGNQRIRTAAVEACQTPWRVPQISRALKARRIGTDQKYTEIADRCMQRLNKRANHLLYRGKIKNKVKVACARELLCFVWEALQAATV